MSPDAHTRSGSETARWMDGQIDGWTDGQADGWMDDGWIQAGERQGKTSTSDTAVYSL